MSLEARAIPTGQLLLPSTDLTPRPVVVSASRRTEMVGLRPNLLVERLQRFPQEIHSVVLWTKDPTNIYENKELREELAKHNLLVHFTLTGMAGTRIEPTVPDAETLLARMPQLLDFLGDPRRLRWRFDPIVTLKKEDGEYWSSVEYFPKLAQAMAKFGINNCYFSFCQIYPKFAKRHLAEAGIYLVTPSRDEQRVVVGEMKKIADRLGIALYSCAQPLLENIPGITPAKCIDAELLTELHPQKLPADPDRDATQEKYRPACYCTESKDIGSYLACGHGCVYCYAEAAVPIPTKLIQKPMPE
ncbi:MAG: DUF1848 family protein [Candidatus Levybacteria bacterium]|nr:DUF1848 family protein [Candidatus Levybacteria bacterium]